MERSSLTTKEVAEALGVTPARVRQMVIGGLLPSEKVGRDVLIPVHAIETAKGRKTKPGPKAKDAATDELAVNEADKPTTKPVKDKSAKAKKAAKKKV